MNILRCLTIVALLIAGPAYAQIGNLYDTFNGGLLDPQLWNGVEFGGSAQRDQGAATEAVREINRGKLRLFYRIHGRTTTDLGVSAGGTRLHIADPAGVNGFGATVQIGGVVGHLDCSISPLCGHVVIQKGFVIR